MYSATLTDGSALPSFMTISNSNYGVLEISTGESTDAGVYSVRLFGTGNNAAFSESNYVDM